MRLPTSAWSTIPCSPPMTLVSIVGHASFHTAGRSGPSIIERSYFRRPGLPVSVAGAATGAAGTAEAAVASVNSARRPPPASDHRIDAPRSGAGKHEIQKDEAVKNGRSAPVDGWPERHRKVDLKVCDRHLAGQHERNRPRQKSERERPT